MTTLANITLVDQKRSVCTFKITYGTNKPIASWKPRIYYNPLVIPTNRPSGTLAKTISITGNTITVEFPPERSIAAYLTFISGDTKAPVWNFSNTVFLDTFSNIVAPTDLTAVLDPSNMNNVLLSWRPPLRTGGSNINAYIIEYSLNQEVWSRLEISSSSTTTNVSGKTTYSLSGLNTNFRPNKSYRFRIYAKNLTNTISGASNIAVLSLESPALLFNVGSWSDIDINPTIKTSLDKAAARWNKLLKFKKNIVDKLLIAFPRFRGIELFKFNYYNNPQLPAAKCVPAANIKLSRNQYNTLVFNLYINQYYLDNASLMTDYDWELLFVHHLGHALGLGVYWTHPDVQGYEGSPNYLLDGNIYKNTCEFYNRFLSYPPNQLVKKKIPIDHLGPTNSDSAVAGSGVTGPIVGDGCHWPAVLKDNNYPVYPFDLDIMAYKAPSTLPDIRLITIKNLVDLGYDEVKPNNYESFHWRTVIGSGGPPSSIMNNKIMCGGNFYNPQTQQSLVNENITYYFDENSSSWRIDSIKIQEEPNGSDGETSDLPIDNIPIPPFIEMVMVNLMGNDGEDMIIPNISGMTDDCAKTIVEILEEYENMLQLP